jgi:hypothetical protein
MPFIGSLIVNNSQEQKQLVLEAILSFFSSKDTRLGVVSIGSIMTEFTQSTENDTLLFQRGAKVIDLNSQNVTQIIKSLSTLVLKCQIIHFELGRNKELQFGAYDNFSHISFGTDITAPFLEHLVEKSVIEKFNIK